MSNVDFCLASKSAGVSSRSSLALVRDTDTRIPVSMLYAVTQLAWLSSTFVPTSTRSSSSSSLRLRLLARFCRYASAHRRASSSGTISSRGASDCIERVVLRTRFSEARRVPVEPATLGEKRPLACASSPSLDCRPGGSLGTSSVCLCLRDDGGCRWPDGEVESGLGTGWYAGGDEKRCGEVLPVGECCSECCSAGRCSDCEAGRLLRGVAGPSSDSRPSWCCSWWLGSAGGRGAVRSGRTMDPLSPLRPLTGRALGVASSASSASAKTLWSLVELMLVGRVPLPLLTGTGVVSETSESRVDRVEPSS